MSLFSKDNQSILKLHEVLRLYFMVQQDKTSVTNLQVQMQAKPIFWRRVASFVSIASSGWLAMHITEC